MKGRKRTDCDQAESTINFNLVTQTSALQTCNSNKQCDVILCNSVISCENTHALNQCSQLQYTSTANSFIVPYIDYCCCPGNF